MLIQKIALLLFSILYCLPVALAPSSYAQEVAQEAPAQTQDAAAQDEQDMEMHFTEVTDKHRVVFMDLGTWDADITMYGGPEPMKAVGVEVNTQVGSCWKISDFKYELDGIEFQGRGQFTYDSIREKYVGTWIDSATDQLSMMVGDFDEATGTLEMMMDAKGPDGSDMQMKATTVQTEENNRSFTLSMQLPGSENWVPIMEAVYTKRD